MSNPVYLLYGEEDFLIDEELKKLKTQCSSANIETIDGSACSLETLISAISSSPLLFGERTVVIRDFPMLKSSQKRGKSAKEEGIPEKQEDISQLVSFLGNVPGNIKVFFVVYGSVDARRKLFKAIEKIGVVKEMKPFAEWEQEKLLSFIVDEVRAEKKKIGSHAAQLLLEIAGTNLRALSSEIKKLATFAGDRESIEENDVKSLASAGKISIFSLTSSLKQRDMKGALAALERLIKDREEPAAIIALLASQFRMLLQVKSLKLQGLGEYQVAQRLSASPFYVKKSLEGAKHFTLDELKRNMDLLLKADIKLKEGYSNHQVILEVLMTDLLEASVEK